MAHHGSLPPLGAAASASVHQAKLSAGLELDTAASSLFQGAPLRSPQQLPPINGGASASATTTASTLVSPATAAATAGATPSTGVSRMPVVARNDDGDNDATAPVRRGSYPSVSSADDEDDDDDDPEAEAARHAAGGAGGGAGAGAEAEGVANGAASSDDDSLSGEATDVLGDTGISAPEESVPMRELSMKRFSSRCLRPSVWPSSHNLLPPKGLPKLQTGDAMVKTLERGGSLRLRVCNWNMHAKKPPTDLSALIPKDRYHVVVFGSCECVHTIAASIIMRNKKEWEQHLQKSVGTNYVKLRSHVLQAIHLIIFAHKDVLPLISDVKSAAVACGVANTLGNKGGVAIRLKIMKSSFLFVSCHLEAHQNNVKHRNANFHRIEGNLKFGGDSDESLKKAASERYDHAVYLGDMNYRINGNRSAVDTLIASRMHEVLWFNDQMRIEMAKGNVFKGFSEGPVHFQPTYKFDKNSNTYDSSKKQRIPSWTDRIVYRSNSDAKMKLIAYDSVDTIRTSDHRPVYAVFEVPLELDHDASAVHADTSSDPGSSNGSGEGTTTPTTTTPTVDVGADGSTPGNPDSSDARLALAAARQANAEAEYGHTTSQVCAIM